uniref:Bursicon n=1 Tax=Panagrellus redivivus TaxID=6233 RepID=A0A7E4WDI8_PANRE
MPVLQPSLLLVILVCVTLGAAAPLDDPRIKALSLDTFRRLKPAGEDVIVDSSGSGPLFNPLQSWRNAGRSEHRQPHKSSHHHSHQHHKHNSTHLHHKTQNPIVKTPPSWLRKSHDEPKETCISTIFSQKVHMKGCETKFVLNRYCHGTCPSIFIPGSDMDQDLDQDQPHDPRTKKLQAEFENCTYCRPAEIEDISIPLRCDEGIRVRKIVRIKRCACMNRNELHFRR